MSVRLRIHLFTQVILVTLSGACTTISEIHLEDTSTPVIPTISSTSTHLEPSNEPRVGFNNSEVWKQIWVHDRTLYGMPLAFQEDSQGNYWILYESAVIHLRSDNDFKTFTFGNLIPCADCSITSNGSIAISQDDDVWIGLSDSLLVIKSNSEVMQITDDDIFPLATQEIYLRPLLADRLGRIWISGNHDLLYSNDGVQWISTHYRESLNQNPNQIPDVQCAALGSNNEIWFSGTTGGMILHYSNDQYSVEFLESSFPSPIYQIGALAFNETTETLWAVETSPPSCGEGQLSDTIGIYKRSSNGMWQGYNKSLFQADESEKCFGVFSDIDIMRDGNVWVSMKLRHGLVYFENNTWYTWDGEQLPFSRESKIEYTYILDILVTKSGHLLIMNPLGIYQYLGLGG